MLPLERIQQQLSADAALVLWIDDLGEHLGCVLRHRGPPIWVSLPGSGKGGAWTTDDDSLPQRCYAALIDPTTGAELRTALYRQRLAPLEEHLQGTHNLLVVPTGALAKNLGRSRRRFFAKTPFEFRHPCPDLVVGIARGVDAPMR